MNTRQPKTKCWTCQNAVPNAEHGCNWSRYGEPVEGWTAQYNEILSNEAYKDTYCVLACPEYVRDEPRKRNAVRHNENGKYGRRAVIV